MTEDKVITVNPTMFGKGAEAKTAVANKVAKKFGIGEEALAAVEDYRQALTDHDARNLPFMGYNRRRRRGVFLCARSGERCAELGCPQGLQGAALRREDRRRGPACCSHIATSTGMAPRCSCSCTTNAVSTSTSRTRGNPSAPPRRDPPGRHEPPASLPAPKHAAPPPQCCQDYNFFGHNLRICCRSSRRSRVKLIREIRPLHIYDGDPEEHKHTWSARMPALATTL